jgi:plasmid stabilization system protein ParE
LEDGIEVLRVLHGARDVVRPENWTGA